MANVLVVGASRGIGLEAVRQGLAHGHRVRAMARSASNIELTDAKLEIYPGDALVAADVEAALEDIDAVIQTLGIATGPDLVLDPGRFFSESTRILLHAMREKAVPRLISVTGFGAGDSRERMGFLHAVPFRLFLGRAYDDKTVQEQLIRDSGLDWVIARPVILTNGPKTGRYNVLVDRADWRSGMISRADVADFLVRQIDSNTYLGETPVLAY